MFRALAFASIFLSTPLVAFGQSVTALTGAQFNAQYTETLTISDSRFRLSNLNWDMATTVPATSITTFEVVQQQDLGTQAALNGVTWDFSLSFAAGVGYTFTLSDPTPPGGFASTYATSWIAPSANGVSPTRSFNAIQMYVGSGQATYSMSATGLAFSSATVSQAGTLGSLSATNPGATFVNQWLVADVDLSQHNWTLSGQVVGAFTTEGKALNDQVKFDVLTSQVSAVPEAGSLALIPLGLGGLWLARRRRAVRSAEQA